MIEELYKGLCAEFRARDWFGTLGTGKMEATGNVLEVLIPETGI